MITIVHVTAALLPSAYERERDHDDDVVFHTPYSSCVLEVHTYLSVYVFLPLHLRTHDMY